MSRLTSIFVVRRAPDNKGPLGPCATAILKTTHAARARSGVLSHVRVCHCRCRTDAREHRRGLSSVRARATNARKLAKAAEESFNRDGLREEMRARASTVTNSQRHYFPLDTYVTVSLPARHWWSTTTRTFSAVGTSTRGGGSFFSFKNLRDMGGGSTTFTT